jgi:hypothetical protein
MSATPHDDVAIGFGLPWLTATLDSMEQVPALVPEGKLDAPRRVERPTAGVPPFPRRPGSRRSALSARIARSFKVPDGHFGRPRTGVSGSRAESRAGGRLRPVRVLFAVVSLRDGGLSV